MKEMLLVNGLILGQVASKRNLLSYYIKTKYDAYKEFGPKPKHNKRNKVNDSIAEYFDFMFYFPAFLRWHAGFC